VEPSLILRLVAAFTVIGAVLFTFRIVAGYARSAAPRARGRRALRVIESLALPGAASVHLLEAGGRYLLIGRSAASLVLLAELSGESVGTDAHPARR